MADQSTITELSDTELDSVAGGKQGNKGGGGTVVEIVEISIGEIVAAAAGNSTVTVNLAGIGNNMTANTGSKAGHRRG